MGQAIRGIIPGPAKVVYAMEESLGDSKHERRFYSFRASAATFDVCNMVEIATNPTATAELRALVLRIKSMSSDESDVMDVGEWSSFSEPDFFIAENNIIEKGG